jgi:ribose-phosphate pyrophosphokinase
MKKHLYVTYQNKLEQTFVLSLDEKFNPFKSQENLFFLKHKKFDFLGGEPHFQILNENVADYPGDLIITQRYNSVKDLMDVVLANDAAKRAGYTNIKLILPYFPAARQDRVCNDGEPLTIKVFTDIINACGFKQVFIMSPHSEVTPALLNNVVVLDELKYVDQILESFHHAELNIVCPDAGAGKRVSKVVQHLANGSKKYTKINLIRCEKVRDVKDGSLKEFHVQADDLGQWPTLIIDDIVSLGGTFVGLGKVLKERNCGKLMLFTSHADCYDGIKRMTEFFDMVYTVNTRKNWGDLYYPFNDKFKCLDFKI